MSTNDKKIALIVQEGSKVRELYSVPANQIPDVNPPPEPGDKLQVIVEPKVIQVSEDNQEITINASNTKGSPRIMLIRQVGGLPRLLLIPIFSSIAKIVIPSKNFYRLTFQVQAWDIKGNYDQDVVYCVPAEACPVGQHRDPQTGLCVPDVTEQFSVKFLQASQKVQPGAVVLLEAEVKGNIASFTFSQTAGSAVQLLTVEGKQYARSFIMPDTPDNLDFEIKVTEAGTGNVLFSVCQIQKLATPQPGNYPIAFKEWYNSDQVLAQANKTLESSKYEIDGVCLPSGASGAKSHKIENNWLNIDTGGGNGRIYWDFHRAQNKTIMQDPKFGVEHVFTGTFVRGGENLSIKIGNHGSDGRELDGVYVFGGFGVSFHESEVQSKAEYWHNNQGNEVAETYPNGKKVDQSTEYKFFLTLVQNKTANTAVLNVWLDFNDGNKWTKVMTDRTWNKSGWSPGSIPDGDDKAEIANGPGGIKSHTVWTRANSGNSKVKAIAYGIPS